MTTKHFTYSLKTLKFYPRPDHFKRRIESLYPRFNNVVNVFPPSFHNGIHRRNIDFEVKVFSRPVNIIVISNTDVELKELVITHLDEYSTYAAKSPEELFCSERGLSIFVCYIKVGDTTSQGHKSVRRVIDYFNAKIRDGRHEEDIFKSLFICCEISSYSDNEIPTFRAFINSCLNHTPDTWQGEERIIIGPDNVLLGSKVSQHLEDTVLEILWLIYEYLDRFVCTKKSNLQEIGDVAHVDVVENTLYNFVRNGRDLLDVRQLISRDIDEGNTGEEFDESIIETLAARLKCAILPPLAHKLGLNRDICSICLEEIRTVNILKRHVLKNSKNRIRKLKVFNEKLEEQLKKEEDLEKEYESPKKSKRHKIRYITNKNDHMVHSIQNDISDGLREVETELRKATKHIYVVEKMQFEIEGYFKLAGIEIGTPYIAAPEAIKNDLFRIPGVMGVGTIYGQFEVHVRSNDRRVRKEVSDVLRRHNFYQYKIRKVDKKDCKSSKYSA